MMITDYYEGLRKAAEDIPDDVAKAIRTVNEGVKYNPPIKAVLEYLYVYGYIYAPLVKLDLYMTKTKFDPQYYNECVENDTSVHRGINYHADEIYDILSTINPTSAAYVIGKITNESGSYDDLCLAIKNQNKDNFVETMRNGNCHITKEVNNLCLFFATSSETFFSDKFDKNDTIEDKVDTIFNLWNEYDVHFESESINAAYSEMINLMYELPQVDVKNNPQQYYSCINHITELLTTIGQYLYYTKFYIRENTFTPREKAILDTVTTRPEVASYFEQWRREFEDEENKDEELQKKEELTIDNDEEVENTKTPKTPVCWIINGTEADAITWSYFIKESVINSLYGQVGKFSLPEKTTPKQAKKYIARICAALIYKAAEKIGLAKPYLTTDRIGVSFEKTISPVIEDYRRQDMMLYMSMLDVFDRMEECKRRNSFNRGMRTFKSTDTYTVNQSQKYRIVNEELDSENPKDILIEFRNNNRDLAHILLNNYDLIKETLSWLSLKMKTKMPK